MERNVTVAYICVCLAVVAGLWTSWFTNELYPGLPASAAVVGVLLVVVALAWGSRYARQATLIAAIVGAGYRFVTFLFVPSMIGFDPDAYAVRSQAIVATGYQSPFVSGFYRAAAHFVMLGAETTLVSGLPVNVAYVVFPIAVGVLAPLLAAALVRRAGGGEVGGAVAAILAALGPSTIRYSIAPVPITVGGILVATAVVLLMVYQSTRKRSWEVLGGFYLVVFAAALTHKITLLVLSGTVVAAVALSAVSKSQYLRHSGSVVLLVGVLPFTQWTYLSDFLVKGVTLLYLLATSSISLSSAHAPTTAANIYHQGLVARFLDLLYLPVVLLCGGIAWLVSFVVHRRDRSVGLLLAACAASVAAVVPGIVLSAGPGFKRVFVYASILVAAIIGAFVGDVYDRLRRSERVPVRVGFGVVGLLIGAVIVAQMASMPVTPHTGDGVRYYLTEQQVQGKKFAETHADGTVVYDMYYGDEVVRFAAATEERRNVKQVPTPQWTKSYMNRELTNHDVLSHHYRYVALRTGVRVYRLAGGRFILKWSPTDELDQHYSKVYSNGGMNLYIESGQA